VAATGKRLGQMRGVVSDAVEPRGKNRKNQVDAHREVDRGR
jgi:hypothetical protein